MGKLGKVRNHLLCLFPRCFSRELPRAPGGAELMCFQRVIVDLMQYVVGTIKYGGSAPLHSDDVIRCVQDTMRFYLCEQSAYYTIGETLVLLLDNPEYVPALKSATQKTRDGVGGARILDARLFDEVAARLDLGLCDHLLIDEWTGAIPFDRGTIWRSIFTRLQLVRLISHAIIFFPSEVWSTDAGDVTVVLDDGFAIHPDLYCERRSQMIDDYGFHAKSAYAQECLVGALSRHHLCSRLYVYPDGEFSREPSRAVGEADIKVCFYIERGGGPYLLVSQDTDSIYILFKHLNRLEQEGHGEGDLPSVWLDMRRPQDERAGKNRVYRYINITQLYRDILALFAEEYPSVRHPIETLVLLTYSLETDFTRAFHKYLNVQPHTVWDTFSELHTPSTRLVRQGFLLFESNASDDDARVLVPRREMKRTLPLELRGLLNEVVRIDYCAERDTYDVSLDELPLQRFYYLLCEFKVRQDLVTVGYHEYEHKHIMDTDQLFMRIAQLEDVVALCRAQGLEGVREREASAHNAFISALEETKREARLVQPKVKSRFTAAANTQVTKASRVDWGEWKDWESAGDVVENPGAMPLLDKKILVLSQKEIPPRYGVPSVPSMLARIYRIEWMLNMHQNGWISSEYALQFDAVHEKNARLSKHGWRTREIVQTDEAVARGDFNNAYYTHRYVSGTATPGVIPFRVFETEETDEIYNRRHAEYAFAHQYLK